MKEYKFDILKKNIVRHMNDAAKDGWRLISYSANTSIGTSLSYCVIYERDLEMIKNKDEIVEYKIVTSRKNKWTITDDIYEYESKGYKFVAFSNNVILGSSISHDFVFLRTIKIL